MLSNSLIIFQFEIIENMNLLLFDIVQPSLPKGSVFQESPPPPQAILQPPTCNMLQHFSNLVHVLPKQA
jgi:hypothetical protein